jgi:hypothetical protein
MTELGPERPGVDPTTPSPARLYDYYLGGTHNLPVDRAMAAYLKAAVPDLLNGGWSWCRRRPALSRRSATWARGGRRARRRRIPPGPAGCTPGSPDDREPGVAPPAGGGGQRLRG